MRPVRTTFSQFFSISSIFSHIFGKFQRFSVYFWSNDVIYLYTMMYILLHSSISQHNYDIVMQSYSLIVQCTILVHVSLGNNTLQGWSNTTSMYIKVYTVLLLHVTVLCSKIWTGQHCSRFSQAIVLDFSVMETKSKTVV